jgi:AcrR family transcriptional regulator
LTDSQSNGGLNIRITKNPEERRKELIDIAEKLFIKKGYEQTAVSDIVKEAKVAQGTFYYYFKTKEEILDLITDRYININVKGYEKIANEKGPNALDKIINIFKFSSSFRNNRNSLIQYLHEDKNAHLHLKFERKLPVMIAQPLSKIISQGVQEKYFNTAYPHEAAKAFIGISAMVMQGIYNKKPDSTVYKRMLLATFDFLERILGAKSGLILNAYKKIGGIK